MHGRGSVGETPDGRLRVTVTWPGGRRIYRHVPKYLVAKDRRAAMRLAEKYRAELIERRDADLLPTSQTTGAWLRSWIGSLREAHTPRVRARTLSGYEAIVEQDLIPAFGNIPLERLSGRAIQRWVDTHPARAGTVSNHYAVLRRALNVAVRTQVLARNPSLSVELPDRDWHGGTPLTLDEARRLLDCAEGLDALAPLWRLAIDTGFRQGELLGLGWDDIDLEAGTVTLRAQLQRRNGQWVRTSTKADRAVERIAIGPSTVAALRALKVQQASERQPWWPYWGHVFLTPKGEPYAGWTVLRLFHEACDAAGIPRRRFHDLRLTAATLLRDLGVAEDTRQARLGHATTDMARHYAKASETQDRLAAERLDAALAANFAANSGGEGGI